MEPLSESSAERLRGVRLLLIKPSFPVKTSWAYSALAADPEHYLPAERAESRLAEWLATEDAPVRDLLFNNFEPVVFRKYIPLPTLKKRLERELDLPVLMSGSGSTLFALIENKEEVGSVRECVGDAFGEEGWVAEARIV